MASLRRTTASLQPKVYRTLKVKGAMTGRSIPELINPETYARFITRKGRAPWGDLLQAGRMGAQDQGKGTEFPADRVKHEAQGFECDSSEKRAVPFLSEDHW